MNTLVLPKSFYETKDKPDAAFVKQLTDLDPLLLTYWNTFKGRWVIDRYGCANDGHVHTHTCPRQSVMIVESPEKTYMPLGDRVMEQLRSMDMWRQADSADELNERGIEKRDKIKRAVEKDIRSDVRHLILDNKEQFKKIQTTIQMHDMRPNDLRSAVIGNDADLGEAVIGQRSQGAK